MIFNSLVIELQKYELIDQLETRLPQKLKQFY